MTRYAVLSVRLGETPIDARRHLELVGRLEREQQAYGGRVVGFGASCVSFAFPEEQLPHAIGLASFVLTELGEHSVGISLRELVWDADDRRAWGLALVLSETLAASARPGEVLVDPEIRELGALARRSATRVQLGDVVLRANLCTPELSDESSSNPAPAPLPTTVSPSVPSLPARRLPPPERRVSTGPDVPLPASAKAVSSSNATLHSVVPPTIELSDEEPEPKTQRFSRRTNPPPKPSMGPGAKSTAAPPPKPSSVAAPPRPSPSPSPRRTSAAPPFRRPLANPPKAPSRALSPDSAPTQPRPTPPPLLSRNLRNSRDGRAGDDLPLRGGVRSHTAAPSDEATPSDDADEDERPSRVGTAADRHSIPPPKPATRQTESIRPERPSVVDALRSGNPDSMLRLADRLKGEGGQESLVSRLEAMAKLANGDIVLGLGALREAARVAMDKDSKNQARATLALAVGLAMAGRKQEALLQGLEALSRARARGDERGEVACTTFIGQLSKTSGEADVTNAWLSLHADAEG